MSILEGMTSEEMWRRRL